jgi:hypothetical protein
MSIDALFSRFPNVDPVPGGIAILWDDVTIYVIDSLSGEETFVSVIRTSDIGDGGPETVTSVRDAEEALVLVSYMVLKYSDDYASLSGFLKQEWSGKEGGA